MAQLAQQDTPKIGGRGNTNTLPNSRYRSYCFTLNNYTVEDVKSIQKLNCKYCFQEEKGENKTPHLQGVLYFKNPRSFNSIKKMLPRAHIEKTINFHASVRYCSKEDTRCGHLYTNLGDLSKYGTNDTAQLALSDEARKFKYDFEKWKNEMIEKQINEDLLDPDLHEMMNKLMR